MFISTEALKYGSSGFVPPTLSGNGSLVRRLRDSRPTRAVSRSCTQFSSHPASFYDCKWPLASVAASAPSVSTGFDTSLSSFRAAYDDRLVPAVSETAIVFTPDAVRLHDHPALAAATSAGHRFVVPVLVAHQRAYDLHGGLCAWHAAVSDLRRSLRARGSDLIVVNGSGLNGSGLNGSGLSVSNGASDSAVARAVLNVCDSLRAGAVYTHANAPGNRSPLNALCDELGVDCIVHWNGTVLSPKELPFDLGDLPDDCDAFASATQLIKGNEPFNVPTTFPPLSPDALRMVTNLPSCPAASSRIAHDGVQRLPLLPFSESEALQTAMAFFSSSGGVASALPLTRSSKEENVGSSCECARNCLPQRSIDTILGRLGKALATGTLSSRQLNYIMTNCELSSSSPRSFCAKLEIMQHDFAVFIALRKALTRTAAVEHPSKSPSR